MAERLLEAITLQVHAGRASVRRALAGTGRRLEHTASRLLSPCEDAASRLFARLERARGHAVPLALIAVLVAVAMRNVLFRGEVPAGTDSAFLFSDLRLFAEHHVLAFTGWAPEPFGQTQQYSVYWLLAMFTTLTGSVMGVYDIALLVTFLLGAVGAYRLAFWIGGSRLGAVVAAAIYVFAPFSIAQWASGHLNVEISYALGPWLLWALWLSLRDGSRRAMIGLGLAGSAAYLLTTGQAFYWLLPLAAVACAEAARQRAAIREYGRRLLAAAVIALAVFATASAVELFPLAAGIKAPFAESGSKFYIQGLAIHAKYSEPLIRNVLGVPTEDWSTTSLAGSSFTDLPYYALSLALLVFAAGALRSARRRIAVTLTLPAATAWLISAGPDGPTHGAYVALYNHVPYFSLLRVPNRWTMVATLAVALLVALRIAAFRSRERERTEPLALRRASVVAALWVSCLVLFLGAYAFIDGLPSERLPASYAAAYSKLAADHTDTRVLTTPFWQAWMPLDGKRAATSIHADLGAVSRYWNGHPTVFRGGWDPRASRFVTYLYDLVKQGTTRSLTKLVGAVGVKYVGVNPQRALEVVPGQNPFFRRQLGLVPFARSGRVTIYRNLYALPPAYTVHRACLVAGGMHVLGDLAEQPWFSFARTGIVFADQVASVQGRAALATMLHDPGQCVVLAPGGLDDLSVLLESRDTVSAGAAAPSTLPQTPTDPATDVGAEPAANVEIRPGQGLDLRVRAPSGGRYSIWIAGLYGLGRGRMTVQVDGHRPASTDFLNAGSGISWTRLPSVALGPGKHRVVIANHGPAGGSPVDLSQVALMPAKPAGGLDFLLRRPGVLREEGGPGPVRGQVRLGRPIARSAWQLQQNGNAVRARPMRHGIALDVVAPGRAYFTLARLPVGAAVDPSRGLALRFRGAGSGLTFYLIASFNGDPQARAVFSFADTTRAERTIVFFPLQPSSVDSVPDWSHVTDLSLAVNSKATIAAPITVSGPYATGLNKSPRFGPSVDRGSLARGPLASGVLSPSDQMIGVTARLKRRVGPGLLVLTQAFDPHWRLHGDVQNRHTIALGFANAYSLRSGMTDGHLAFDAAGWAEAGTVISLLAWMAGFSLLLAPGTRRAFRAALSSLERR